MYFYNYFTNLHLILFLLLPSNQRSIRMEEHEVCIENEEEWISSRKRTYHRLSDNISFLFKNLYIIHIWCITSEYKYVIVNSTYIVIPE